jgi:hypothetical protein
MFDEMKLVRKDNPLMFLMANAASLGISGERFIIFKA